MNQPKTAPPAMHAGGGRPAALERERVSAALVRVNAWLTARVASFSPLDEHVAERFTLRMQSFGEICLYLHLAQTFDVAAPEALISPIRDGVLSDRFRTLLLGSPARTAKLLFCLLPYGWREAFDGVPRYCQAVCRPLANEMQPFQLLAHIYAFDALNLYDAQAAELEARALGLSALRNGAGHFSTADKGPYTFTHSAFYATRFGARTVALSKAEVAAIANYADIELCRAFSLRNLDVALEIVLARLCLFAELSERDTVVVESAISLIEENGYLRSPAGAKSVFDDPAEQEWEQCYHTMAVMGILLMKLASDHQPIAFEAARTGDTPYMEELALAMDCVGTMYSAVEAGNPAMAVYVYSKLGELRAEVRPPPSQLAPIEAYIDGIASLVRSERSAEATGANAQTILGMPAEDFDKVMRIYEEARCAR